MRVTHHGQKRGRERMGVNMHKFAQMLRARGLELEDGKHETEFGTLIVKDGALVTVLTTDMVAV